MEQLSEEDKVELDVTFMINRLRALRKDMDDHTFNNLDQVVNHDITVAIRAMEVLKRSILKLDWKE